MTYEPPFTLTGKATSQILEINQLLVILGSGKGVNITPKLRRINRVRSIHSSLAIEQNTMAYSEVRDIIDGKFVQGPPKEIKEVQNAFRIYSMMDEFNPFDVNDLIRAHSEMMHDLGINEGFRKRGEGVFNENSDCIHMAPPAEYVPGQMNDLFEWIENTEYPMLVASCVFHYEFEFIHPFEDGNGRIGRFWHTLMLSRWNEVFKWAPIESAIRAEQEGYYSAIAESNSAGNSTKFVEFMLGVILRALTDFRKDVVSANPKTSGFTSNESEVYSLIRNGEFQTIAKAAILLDLSTSTVERTLVSLKKKGMIERIGANKNGRWKVVGK